MLGISLGHFLILLVIVLFLGRRRIPEVSRLLGKTYRNFRDSLSGTLEPPFKKLDSNEPPKDNKSEPRDQSRQKRSE